MSIRDRINAKITKYFIDDNPVQVALRRPTFTKSSTGGRGTTTYENLAEQTFTCVAPGFRGETAGFTSSDGSVIEYDFALVGSVDADIEVNDEFTLDGHPYLVQYVDESRDDWAKRAAVTRRRS